MLLIIFNTYVSNLVDALELNIPNSPFSWYVFCILKIPDTDTSFPMRDCEKQNFSMERVILKIIILTFPASS